MKTNQENNNPNPNNYTGYKFVKFSTLEYNSKLMNIININLNSLIYSYIFTFLRNIDDADFRKKLYASIVNKFGGNFETLRSNNILNKDNISSILKTTMRGYQRQQFELFRRGRPNPYV